MALFSFLGLYEPLSDKTALEGAWAIQYFGYGEKAYCKGCILGAGNTGHL